MFNCDIEKVLKLLMNHDDWKMSETYLKGETFVKKYSCVINGVEVVLDDNTGDLKVDNIYVELSKKEYRDFMEHFRQCEKENKKKSLDEVFTKILGKVE